MGIPVCDKVSLSLSEVAGVGKQLGSAIASIFRDSFILFSDSTLSPFSYIPPVPPTLVRDSKTVSCVTLGTVSSRQLEFLCLRQSTIGSRLVPLFSAVYIVFSTSLSPLARGSKVFTLTILIASALSDGIICSELMGSITWSSDRAPSFNVVAVVLENIYRGCFVATITLFIFVCISFRIVCMASFSPSTSLGLPFSVSIYTWKLDRLSRVSITRDRVALYFTSEFSGARPLFMGSTCFLSDFFGTSLSRGLGHEASISW